MEEEGQPMPVLLKGVFIRLSRIYLCIYIYISETGCRFSLGISRSQASQVFSKPHSIPLNPYEETLSISLPQSCSSSWKLKSLRCFCHFCLLWPVETSKWQSSRARRWNSRTAKHCSHKSIPQGLWRGAAHSQSRCKVFRPIWNGSGGSGLGDSDWIKQDTQTESNK